MENILLFLFGRKYLFFNMRNGLKAAVWIAESELAMTKKKIFDKSKEIEGLNATIEAGKREDGSPITDPKEIDLIKEDIHQAEQMVKMFEGNILAKEEELKQVKYKLAFVNEYAPKVGRWIVLAAIVIVILILL